MAEPSRRDLHKRQAAEEAVSEVESGMVVGLGTGTTARFALEALGRRIRAGELREVQGVPTSEATKTIAGSLGVSLTTLDEHPEVDITIDGADEVNPGLDLIKGGGGALLREKIVAQASRREVIIVDDQKLSAALGTIFAVPVEVVRFGMRPAIRCVESLGARATLRGGEARPFVTDGGNLILDCDFGPIPEPAALAEQLAWQAAIVEHGLFIGLVSELVVAGDTGLERRLPGDAQPARARR
jgi:ribose 5-phosphate isomerase A